MNGILFIVLKVLNFIFKSSTATCFSLTLTLNNVLVIWDNPQTSQFCIDYCPVVVLDFQFHFHVFWAAWMKSLLFEAGGGKLDRQISKPGHIRPKLATWLYIRWDAQKLLLILVKWYCGMALKMQHYIKKNVTGTRVTCSFHTGDTHSKNMFTYITVRVIFNNSFDLNLPDCINCSKSCLVIIFTDWFC